MRDVGGEGSCVVVTSADAADPGRRCHEQRTPAAQDKARATSNGHARTEVSEEVGR
jgi:hypothetical protein